MNKFIRRPNKPIEEITKINKKPKERLIDESFADLQRRKASFEELQAWFQLKGLQNTSESYICNKYPSARGFKY